jgi:hypothetical protein
MKLGQIQAGLEEWKINLKIIDEAFVKRKNPHKDPPISR